ncbi:tRNA lysidine(34) synthetase TilS [Cellulomonas sp. H30R-01]|uniref:tRNA lysidine(34) synthetase TilS n=1 Tax=Cellulomonas sp. H30R-01 TaxID=2704467 RepID=UPI00138D3D51|nr:tRNA lysidine(34) synthetase TilS [Cellulomonas sp. H30R-01]QHT58001.1 tRNA lysidine(34) synthetase TilS [Cellulomonas sp. H30R-01]
MTGPDRRVADVRRAVTGAVADLPDGALVLVACSGGPDSLALAAATAFVADRSVRRGPRVLRAGAVVVDHALQPGSADVAAGTAAVCRTLGLDPVVVERVVVDAPGGPEAAARHARYAALDAVAGRTGAAAVLLGHTLDDQAETVLLGLARGSGARSLAGMPPARGVLRRPLLGLRRTDTVGACAALGLEPWHDPTNAGTADDAPLRSRVRDRVLPLLERELGPGVAQALARTADQLREDADTLDGLAATLLTAAATPTPAGVDGEASAGDGGIAASPPGGGRMLEGVARERTADPGTAVALDVGVLLGADVAVRRRALRAAAVQAGCPGGTLNRGHVLALDALLTDWHGQGPVPLPGGVAASRACGRLLLGPAQPVHDERQER